jgi:hypothetical protein
LKTASVPPVLYIYIYRKTPVRFVFFSLYKRREETGKFGKDGQGFLGNLAKGFGGEVLNYRRADPVPGKTGPPTLFLGNVRKGKHRSALLANVARKTEGYEAQTADISEHR